MYGASGKLGRGRGGGPPKRNIHSTFQPSSVQRPSAAPGGGRLSAGGGHRNRNNTPAAPAAVSTVDETFSLVRNNPLNFGMIIKLSPVLVEEIKRLEAQGHAARIKFDSSANNPVGNVGLFYSDIGSALLTVLCIVGSSVWCIINLDY